MIGRRAIAGLSLLSALFFCVLAAQGALAAAHTSEDTTAFTCVKGGGGLDFKDAHCDETTTAGKGEFGHELIPAGSTTIEVTNEKTAEATTKSTPFTLKGVVGGVETHVICQKVKSTTEEVFKKSTIENGGTGTDHKVTGTVIVDFEGCESIKPASCKVREPIITKLSFMGVDQLPPNKEGMGLEFTADGSEIFAEITYENTGAPKCPLNGKTFPTTGSVIGTGAPGPTTKESGATLVFNEEEGMQNLSSAGKPVKFIGTFTVKMHSVKKDENPIALTTTT
jgi:hypothetical protein